MKSALSRRLAAIVVAGGCSIVIGGPALEAQAPTPRVIDRVGGFGGDAESKAEDAPIPTLYLTPPVTSAMARTWIRLQKPVKMAFANETPLEDVIKYVKSVTRENGDRGVPIYVDPVELQKQQDDKVRSDNVIIDLDGVPLATSLGLLLKQIGLAFHVDEDGLLVITSESNDGAAVDAEAHAIGQLASLKLEIARLGKGLTPGRGGRGRTQPPAPTKTSIRRTQFGGMGGGANPGGAGAAEEPEATTNTVTSVRLNNPLNAKAAETWARLHKTVDFPFADETPLSDVLAFIRKETRADGNKELPIYVDPAGLSEAERTLESAVRLDVPGITLVKALELIVKQLSLRFYVQEDGIVVITAADADLDIHGDRSARILDEITSLRVEVDRLRHTLEGRR
jgi:hypothetical protein